MNSIKRYLILCLIAITMGLVYTSCTDDEGETPVIRYIRVTNPQSSDSLLVTAGQGKMIAIVGENLSNVQQVWFNDLRAELNPSFISSNSIITSVPGDIPKEITNKIRLVTGDGKTIFHDFIVDISKPEVKMMDCEYVKEGGTAIIRGSFFYAPVTVSFSGGAQAEVLTVEDEMLEVKVPAGAQPGPVTVSTNFGSTKSDFWFNDTRNIFISSDPFTGWWNANFVVSDPTPADPEKINGNYIRVKQKIGAWQWLEVAGGPPDAMGDISKNIPDEAILRPADYYLKFEVNTLAPYNNNVIKINVGLSDNFYNDEFRWLPPYDTKGQWATVSLPLEEVMSKFDTKVSSKGYYTRILFHGPGDLNADIAFDNFRVVPKKLPK
jgi:hypothetical protein